MDIIKNKRNNCFLIYVNLYTPFIDFKLNDYAYLCKILGFKYDGKINIFKER